MEEEIYFNFRDDINDDSGKGDAIFLIVGLDKSRVGNLYEKIKEDISSLSLIENKILDEGAMGKQKYYSMAYFKFKGKWDDTEVRKCVSAKLLRDTNFYYWKEKWRDRDLEHYLSLK
jgi:hypothetical protein